MKGVIILLVLGVSLAASSPGDHYTDRFDNVNIDEILQNPRLRGAYISCVLDKGRCTNEGKELKSHISEALANHCDKCTDTQRKGTRTVIGYLINHDQQSWNQLVAKYDPQRKYVIKYEQELKKISA